MDLRSTILSYLLHNNVGTNQTTMQDFLSTSYTPTTSPEVTTPVPSAFQEAISGHFSLSTTDYRLVERSVCTWDSDELLPETKFTNLREVKFNPPFCRVMNNKFVFPIIGRIPSDNMQGAVAASESLDGRPVRYLSKDFFAKPNSAVQVQGLNNPGFYGSEVISYNNVQGVFAAENRLESADLIEMFRYVLNVAWMRKPKQTYAVYSASFNPLIDELIKTVNGTVPILGSLEAAVKYALTEYFTKNYPMWELDEHGCPLGQTSYMEGIELAAFECSQSLAIHGISEDPVDYGAKYILAYSNRWYSLQIVARSNNGTNEKFNMTFGRDDLTVQAEGNDLIAPLGPISDEDTNATATIIKFPYKKFIDSKPYEIRLSPEIMGMGLETQVLNVEIRKKGEPNFEELASFQMKGQPRELIFCGFAPRRNRNGVKRAITVIAEAESTLMNTGFKLRPS